MLASQVRIGSVVHNTTDDLYARVIGLIEVGGVLKIQIHSERRPEESSERYANFRVKEFHCWELSDCENQTEREKTGSGYVLIPEPVMVESLDREV
jgi:hypothetical protein